MPQSRTQQKGTPSELYFAAQVGHQGLAPLLGQGMMGTGAETRKLAPLQHFKAQRGRPRGDLPALIAELGLEQGVLNQPWVELSVSKGAVGMHACMHATMQAPSLSRGGQLSVKLRHMHARRAARRSG